MPKEDDTTSINFRPHKNENSVLEKKDIEEDLRYLVGKSSKTRSYVRDDLSGHILQNELFVSESSSSLREVRFSK